MKSLLPVAAFFLIGTVGCNSSGPAVDVNAKETKGDGKEPTPKEAPIPDSLKTDALEYNGIANGRTAKFNYARVAGEPGEAGTQTMTTSADKDGNLTVTIEREGSLAVLGKETWMVKPDGIFLVSSDLGSPASPELMMPAKLSVGTVWDNKYELTSPSGSKVTFDGKSRVEKIEKMEVMGKEYEALLVSQTAKMTNAGGKGDVASKTWYAKGVGVLKMRMEVKDAKGKILTSQVDFAGEGE